MIMQKKLMVFMLSALLLMMALCPAVYADTSDFVDLPPEGHWAHEAIAWAYENGISAGVDASHFAPKAKITRAQAVTMIWRLKNSVPPYGNQELPFADVKPDAYYYKALLVAWEDGWVNGVSEDRFNPDAECTRAQLIAMLGKAFRLFPGAYDGQDETIVKDAADFVDVSENSYYYQSLLILAACGVVAGADDTHFSPDAPCTRAQLAVMLYRIMESEKFG